MHKMLSSIAITRCKRLCCSVALPSKYGKDQFCAPCNAFTTFLNTSLALTFFSNLNFLQLFSSVELLLLAAPQTWEKDNFSSR